MASTTSNKGSTSTSGKGKGSTTPAALHPNPAIAKALAAGDAHKYPSAAAWLRAHGIADKATQRTARQVLRDAGMGVGRGRTYNGQVGKLAGTAARKLATQRKQASKPQAQAQA